MRNSHLFRLSVKVKTQKRQKKEKNINASERDANRRKSENRKPERHISLVTSDQRLGEFWLRFSPDPELMVVIHPARTKVIFPGGLESTITVDDP